MTYASSSSANPRRCSRPTRCTPSTKSHACCRGVDVDRELDAATESVFLDWAIPWMLDNEARFCFAEPNDEESPGFYGLRD